MAEYPEWKSRAVGELDRVYLVKAQIPERVWRDLYVKGLEPTEAADRAKTWHYNQLPEKDRARMRQRGEPQTRK